MGYEPGQSGPLPVRVCDKLLKGRKGIPIRIPNKGFVALKPTPECLFPRWRAGVTPWPSLGILQHTKQSREVEGSCLSPERPRGPRSAGTKAGGSGGSSRLWFGSSSFTGGYIQATAWTGLWGSPGGSLRSSPMITCSSVIRAFL